MDEPLLYCAQGTRGRLKASRLEFEIIAASMTDSTIRIKPWGIEVIVTDEELKKAAVKIG